MTKSDAAAKCREMAKASQERKYEMWSYGDTNTGYEEGKENAFLDAADLIDQITFPAPQPWPPPEDVRECLAFNPRHGTWVSKTKGSGVSWNERMPYEMAYSHWLPMPPKPEGVQG